MADATGTVTERVKLLVVLYKGEHHVYSILRSGARQGKRDGQREEW